MSSERLSTWLCPRCARVDFDDVPKQREHSCSLCGGPMKYLGKHHTSMDVYTAYAVGFGGGEY